MSSRPPIVLLVPPARRLYLRDLYCCVSSKGNYYWPPIDLLAMSGRLRADFDVEVIDAPAEGLSAAATLERVAGARPFAVIALSGSATWDTDRALFEAVQRRWPCLLAIAGDVVVDRARWPLECAAVSALITDFTSDGILEYLRSGGSSSAPGIVRRPDGAGGPPEPRSLFSYPVPAHELFPLSRYRLPQARHYPFTSVLTNFGCPFACSYCIQNRDALGFKHRALDNVVEELEALAALGIRELYFRDPLFEAHRADARALCELMQRRFAFRWSCNCRADTLDEELVALMKAAGCSTIAFGFETVNSEILGRYKKPIDRECMSDAIRLCRRHGIDVAGYFILGLPGEDRPSALETIRFAAESDIEYASFAAPSPDYDTQLRADAIGQGRIASDFRSFDRSGAQVSLSGELDAAEIRNLLRHAMLRFYTHPRRLLRLLGTVGSARQGVELLRAAGAVLRNYAVDAP